MNTTLFAENALGEKFTDQMSKKYIINEHDFSVTNRIENDKNQFELLKDQLSKTISKPKTSRKQSAKYNKTENLENISKKELFKNLDKIIYNPYEEIHDREADFLSKRYIIERKPVYPMFQKKFEQKRKTISNIYSTIDHKFAHETK